MKVFVRVWLVNFIALVSFYIGLQVINSDRLFSIIFIGFSLIGLAWLSPEIAEHYNNN